MCPRAMPPEPQLPVARRIFDAAVRRVRDRAGSPGSSTEQADVGHDEGHQEVEGYADPCPSTEVAVRERTGLVDGIEEESNDQRDAQCPSEVLSTGAVLDRIGDRRPGCRPARHAQISRTRI